MYDFGERGIRDFNHLHKKVVPASKNLIKSQKRFGFKLKKLDPTLDVKGFDMPRGDIEKIKVKGGKIIRVGSDNAQKNNEYFKKYIVPLINRSFSKKELEDLNIYIEYPSKYVVKNHDGTSESFKSLKDQRKFSVIDIEKKKDGPVIIHELLHAVMFSQNKDPKSKSQAEAETELGTLVRLPAHERKKIPCNYGYYGLLKKKNSCKLQKDDVNTIKQNCDVHNKNKLVSCIRENLKKTNIGKLKVPKKYDPNLS
jgi:hypothetical protein